MIAQSDTAEFKNGHQIDYRVLLASGKDLPKQWMSITAFHFEAMFIGKSNSLVDFGANIMLQHHFWTAFADYNFSLLELSSAKRTGLVTMGFEQSYPQNTVYLSRFEGVQAVQNFGLHCGVQRMKNNSHDGMPMANATAPLMAELLVTHELDIGIAAWTRRGIFIDAASVTTGRFFMFRFNADYVYYRFSKFGVRDVNRSVGFGDETTYSYGEDDEQGRWKFEELPFRHTGFKVTADFYWHASGNLGKSAPSTVYGWRARAMIQYVPVSRSANLIYCINVGITLGSKPRLNNLSATPYSLPGDTKSK